MLEEIFLEINNRYDSNIYIHQCGQEICLPKHHYGPAVRDHYLVHFIISGKGKFYQNSKIYDLKANDLFLISPGEITYYEADPDDPWHYAWVDFNGIRSKHYLDLIGINQEHPILTVKNSRYVTECLHNIYESSKIIRGSEVRMLGNLYLFLSQLIEETSPKRIHHAPTFEYVQQAVEFIEMNFARPITVQEIADHLNLNRSYFSDLFKKSIKLSPQKFIIRYRINKACELMRYNPDLSIGDVARSVGYKDPLAFSKVFKKEQNQTPIDYRNAIIDELSQKTPNTDS